MKLLLLAAALLSTGCAIPTEASSSFRPQHHNIPATFVGNPSGPIVWLCATQPRNYEGHLEEDHYLQYSPCPEVPIK